MYPFYIYHAYMILYWTTHVLLIHIQLLFIAYRYTSAQRSAQTLPSKLDTLQSDLDEAANKFDHQQVCSFIVWNNDQDMLVYGWTEKTWKKYVIKGRIL